MQNRSRRVAYPALLCAVGVVLLLLGSFFAVLDLTVAAICSLLILLAVIELGTRTAIATYILTSALALLLCPQKTAALFYATFFGAYPIVKWFADCQKRLWAFFIKELWYLLCFVALFFLSDLLLGTWNDAYPWWYALLIGILGNFVFFVYDVALKRLIVQYMWSWRERFPFLRYKK